MLQPDWLEARKREEDGPIGEVGDLLARRRGELGRLGGGERRTVVLRHRAASEERAGLSEHARVAGAKAKGSPRRSPTSLLSEVAQLSAISCSKSSSELLELLRTYMRNSH